MMTENLQVNNEQTLPSEDPEEPSSEQMKLTVKQRLWRLLMITERKDKSLVPQLVKIKDAMYENFCRTWTRESSYINKIFRLYADKDQDIKILKPQLKLFSQYPVTIPGVSMDQWLKVTQYIKTLKFIREWLSPIFNNIQSLTSEAKNFAAKKVSLENADMFHTHYDLEDEKQTEHGLAKQHLEESLVSQQCDLDRFLQESTLISTCFEDNNYQDLLSFALLWFHYFERKNDVYDAFTSEQLTTKYISFTLPGYHPTTLSLWTFLKIIEQLDFKKHLFAV